MARGNAVCQLQSIQSGWGSSLIAGDTGILLNNRMTYWHLEEDHPNCLMPGKRVRHTMNPVIVTKDDKPVLICGTPGRRYAGADEFATGDTYSGIWHDASRGC